MKPYDSLNSSGQVRRIRAAVVAALDRDGIAVRQCRLMDHQHNTTFHLEASDGDSFMRASRQSDRTAVSVRSEAEWIVELAKAGFPVAAPIPWGDGRLVRRAEGYDLGPGRIFTRFVWKHGKRIARPSSDQWREIGAAMARLHEHTAGRTDLGHGRWDVDGAFGNQGDPEAALRDVETALGIEARAKVEQATGVYARLRPSLGLPQLIHGDLHQFNVLFDGDTMAIVDFDDSGFAPPLYDFVVPMREMDEMGIADMKRALIEGYRSVRPIPGDLEGAYPIMAAHRACQLVMWAVGERHNPTFAKWWERWCRETLAAIP